MKILIYMALSFMSLNAYSNEWNYISDVSNVKTYINIENAFIDGEYVVVQELHDYNYPKKISGNEFRSITSSAAFDCSNAMVNVANHDRIWYSSNMAAGEILHTIKDPDKKWVMRKAQTTKDFLELDTICAQIKPIAEKSITNDPQKITKLIQSTDKDNLIAESQGKSLIGTWNAINPEDYKTSFLTIEFNANGTCTYIYGKGGDVCTWKTFQRDGAIHDAVILYFKKSSKLNSENFTYFFDDGELILREGIDSVPDLRLAK